MSGETEASVSGWTVDTLREHLTQRIDDQDRLHTRRMDDADKAIQAALVSAEKAVSKAEAASEKRFEGVNEFRAQQADLIATFLPRPEYAAAHEALIDRLNVLTERFSALELRLSSRLDTAQGTLAGGQETREQARLNLGAWVGVAALALTVIALVLAYVTRK